MHNNLIPTVEEKIREKISEIAGFVGQIASQMDFTLDMETVIEYCEDDPTARRFGELQFNNNDRTLCIYIGNGVAHDEIGYTKVNEDFSAEIGEWKEDENLETNIYQAICWLYE